MESNVIDFASYLQARQQAVPTWSGLSHATEIEIMGHAVGQSLLDTIMTSEEVFKYSVENVGSMAPETYCTMQSAHRNITEAIGLLLQAQTTLDDAAKRETRGGDNFVDFELPDFHDFPA
jgi:hypothetical protein